MILLLLFVGIGIIIFSRKIFGKWFNHVSLYFSIWTGMLFFFELKLFRYLPLKNETWFVIILGAFSFLIGSLTIYSARKVKEETREIPKKLFIVADGGTILRYIIIITGIIGTLAALYNWYILIAKYGSIVKVLLAASEIYRSRVENKMEGSIPYITAISYVGVCLGSIYTAYKNKLTFFALLPLLAVILKSLASFARIGILIAFVEFIAGYFLTRHFISVVYEKTKIQLKTVILLIVIFAAIIIASGSIKMFRGSYERYRGADPALAELKDNVLFSPSVYLYLSSHVGVLNQFLQDTEEQTKYGENTFAPFFNFLNKFDLVEKVPFNLRGYFIPMWTNTGTYLRDLYSDFGFIGITFIPWLIGLLTSFFWYRFYDTGKSRYLAVLIHLYAIIGITFFSLITRGADWWVGLFLLLIIIPYIEKRAIKESV